MDDLISKKELLEQYKISYGALYRWKRAGLIPEDWFIRKATPTGQETFFRKAQICPRIELILSRNNKQTLENLANELQGKKKSEPVLTIETKFEKHTFLISDLCRITLVDNDETIELLEKLKEKLS